MKKLFYFAFAAMLCCGFTACSDDDDNEGGGNIDNLIGKWTLVKDVWVEDGESGVDEYEPDEYIIYFGEDGVGFSLETYDDQGWMYAFDYSLSGNKLRVVYTDDPEPWIATIKSLSAEQLVLIEEGYDEEDDYSYRYESYYMRYE
ncbi:MAG: lipocalin family protein [Alistipes sp.]|nr:lipocalin family protein [Alistipes sp.]